MNVVWQHILIETRRRIMIMRRIYYNGTIVTMKSEGDYAQALLIEAGIIKEVGSNDFIMSLRKQDDEVIDLKGKTMLPGFIDAHSHFTGVANSLSQCDLHTVNNFQELIFTMKQFIEAHNIAPGEWVVGSGYDHNFLEEKEHPTKLLLDKISTIHPIVIVHASSHMGVANTMALTEMNITDDMKDPTGGTYGRFQDRQEVNGYMEERAFIDFQNNMPMIKLERMMELFKEAQELYASYGITTVQEGMVAKPLFQLLQHASLKHLLYVDVIGFVDLLEHRELTKEYASYVEHYQNHFKIGGYKIFLDGSPQGKTAWMKTPYRGESTYCGYPALEDEQVKSLIQEALEDDLQLLAHCNGDAAAEQYLTQFEQVVKKTQKQPKRPVMIHAQLVQKDQLQRMRPLHMIPSFFIAHTYYWGDIHIQSFGIERASMISPAKTAQELGLCYTFHQDSPVIAPNMLETLWCAVNRKTKQGVILGEQERITMYEALQAITINAAKQYFEEHQKGTIIPGKAADLVILNQNPQCVQADSIKAIKVLETIKHGKTIYRNPEF